MTEKANPLGNIYIMPEAIETIARNAIYQSYGVVGLAPRNLGEMIKRLFNRNTPYGINVRSDRSGLIISVYIIVEYGLRIKSITDSAAHAVKYNVERIVGIPVQRVNVHVRGLRVSNSD